MKSKQIADVLLLFLVVRDMSVFCLKHCFATKRIAQDIFEHERERMHAHVVQESFARRHRRL